MNGLSLFHSVLQDNGYNLYTSHINHMDYAVAPKENNGHLTVVVFLNNKAKDFASSLEFPQLEEIIRASNHVPQDGVKLVFLYVIWDAGRNQSFKGKNIIYIDSENGISYPRKLSSHSRETVNLIDNILCYDNAHKSLNMSRFGEPTKYHTPWMVWVLILFNITAFIVTKNSASQYGYSPKGLLEGSLAGMITYMFVHASLPHLIGNMVSLYCIGTALEEYTGAAKIFFLYILSGIGGALMDLMINIVMNASAITSSWDISNISSTVTVGASGAICGLLTALIVKVLMTPKEQRIYRVDTLVRSIVMILFSGMLIRNINDMAHIGGMISGIICMLIICLADKLDYYKQRIHDTQLLSATESMLYKKKSYL